MIRGLFSPTHLGKNDLAPTPVPLLNAFLYVPSIDRRVTLKFLVDTGADISVLHPFDSTRLATSAAEWRILRQFHSEALGGAGAGYGYYAVPAVLFLTHDNGAPWTTQMIIWIADSASGLDHESLLGRDVLEHFKLTFIQPTELTLEPK